jgi:hypothetical protein
MGKTNLTLEIWPINLVYYLEIELGENLVGGGGGERVNRWERKDQKLKKRMERKGR